MLLGIWLAPASGVPPPKRRNDAWASALQGFFVAEGTSSAASTGQKPFSLWVIAGGLVYAALALLAYAVPFLTAISIGFIAILLLFIILFLVAALFTPRGRRWGYVLGSVAGVGLVCLVSLSVASPAAKSE